MASHRSTRSLTLKRRALMPAIAAVMAAAVSPAAMAGFNAQGWVTDITLTAVDETYQPLGNSSSLYTINPAGGDTNFAWVYGAQTNDAADPWSNTRSTSAPWIGSSGNPSSLPTADAGTAFTQDTSATYNYEAHVNTVGLFVQASATGATNYVTASANMGSASGSENFVSLAPHTILRIDSTVSYNLQQDGQCNGNLCDGVELSAFIATYADGTSGGPAVFKSISPQAIEVTPYASFVADQAGQLNGQEHLSGWVVNDTDNWANYDFFVSLTVAGASVTAVPEPTGAALLLAGLGVVVITRRGAKRAL